MQDNLLFKVALNKAMALCSRREYCVSEISDKLCNWGVDAVSTEKIIGELIKENFLSEERYAVAFVKDKLVAEAEIGFGIKELA